MRGTFSSSSKFHTFFAHSSQLSEGAHNERKVLISGMMAADLLHNHAGSYQGWKEDEALAGGFFMNNAVNLTSPEM